MTSLNCADRREYLRYRIMIAAELITENNEIVPCELQNISLTGAAISCALVDEEAVVRLHLSGFGEIKVSRLRTSRDTERLVYRETEFRIQQLSRFLSQLVEAGAALPTTYRRQEDSMRRQSGLNRIDQCATDLLVKRVDQAIALVSQITLLGGGLPDNVLLFPNRYRKTLMPHPSPDNAA